MKTKKKLPKKKIAVKNKKQFPKNILIGIAVLFVSLFIVVGFSRQQQEILGSAQTISPTYGTIGDCHANGTCPTGGVSPTGGNTVSTGPVTGGPAISTSPCVSNDSVGIMAKKGKSRGKGGGGFFQAFIAFLQQLLQLLQQLLGGGTVGSPGNPPTIAPIPNSGQPSTAPVPSGSQMPCPTNAQPSGQQSQPTTTASSPAPTTPASSSMVPVGIPGTWKLVFDDEFNGTSLDASKWAPYWFKNGANQNGTTMESSNVSESGGYLNLKLQNNTGSIVSTNPTAGGHFQFTFGAMEARINIPASGNQIANWPAWWTDGQSWPTDGEIDVIEGLHGKACYHFPPANNQGGCPAGTYTGWHIFGANWQKGIVTYYYDGKNVGTISSGITSAPMYLILENSDGSSSGPKVQPTTMQVDYVRVWQ